MSSRPSSALSPSGALSTIPGEPSLAHPVTPGPELLETAAGTLRMLAEPTRLHLLWQLTGGPKTVTELTDASGAPRTVVSQHLAKLRLTGLVDTRKDGRHVIYSLHDGHLVRLIRETINHADHLMTGEPAHD
ncbi:metalloregulator ArsR/SmtB family transcription factor (plasmid) [Arthrobacter sp. FW306-05-C]|uniref:ArsR/SmtB family transcription factor n=1 Tax=Micrococcaceae TaxID=1268 RepID=UPI001EF0A682|nr:MULTISPECIES: metalloregulator ArsR/SmtB family transcription factor [unclassified Arthrobacter]UKA69032.1 metalloregulator ArsR/SmtB family transcription factor [Arthrobacter sp. FW306-05-C]UKA73342.1 metalloregulator ArsR/SmtB family transcription factor [Arthrobacter sp. FW306-06-A]